MGTLDLTIQVLDLSPRVTLEDLNTFFAYCGTVEKIQLQKNEDKSQMAFVTFRQPYALETALLLNDAIIIDHPIRVLPLHSSENPFSGKMNNETLNNSKQGLIPAMVQAMASKGYETLNKTKEELEEKYKLSEKSRVLTEQTRFAISTAEQAAGHVGSVITNNTCLSAGALWLSGVLDKAAKCTAELGNNKKTNPNSRKQK